MKEIMDGNQVLYTEKQAASFFNWSTQTMRDIRKKGKIAHLIFQDKTVRYTLEQLENYKNEHLNGTNTESSKGGNN